MSSYTINLLPKKKDNVADKLLHFILYYFRYIIIITQIVVIGVFFFRFREDQKVIDLKQKFRQKQQILAVTSPIVDEAEAIHSKSGYIRTVLDGQDSFLKSLKTLLASIPSTMSLTEIKIDDDMISVRGVSVDVESIRALHKKFIITKGFENAEISTISSQTADGYEFLIEIPSVKKDEKRPPKDSSK